MEPWCVKEEGASGPWHSCVSLGTNIFFVDYYSTTRAHNRIIEIADTDSDYSILPIPILGL